MIKKLVKNKFLNEKPTQSVAAAAFIISLAGIASRILGVIRDRILAGNFGAGDTLDAYYAAFRIPDTLYNLLVLGALSAAFIPVFTELVSKKNEEKAWRMASGILMLQVCAMTLLAIIFAVFAPFFIKLITPGFSPEKMQTTVMFTRIMFLSPIFLGISAIFGGILVSFKKFLAYSIAPIIYNIGIIIGAVVLVPMMGTVGLAWGVVLGAFMHMLIQYPAAKISGFSLQGSIREALVDKGVRHVLRLMIPRAMSIAVTQVNFLVITIFASTLAAGSLAVFNFANNIQSAPLGLFGVSFAIAIFPTLSSYAALENKEEFVKVFSKTVRQVLFFVIPVSVLIFVLRAQIVRVLLGSGKFDWEDTILTFQTLGFLAISLFAQSLIPLLTRSFYALQNTKTPFYIALVSEAVNILAVIFLIGRFQVVGLAIAFSLASVVNMLLLIYFLRKQLQTVDARKIFNSAGKIVVASVIAGIGAQGSKYLIGSQGELDTFLRVFTQLVFASVIGGGLFSLVSYYLKSEEFFKFTHSVTRKVFKVKKTIQEDTAEVTGINH
jgi:putative peptidoglycan lipid II flippase